MGYGWALRGQLGHQPGAMVPGALVGLALAWWRGYALEEALRWSAVCAIATSVGGSMTYGQTIGLVVSHSPGDAYWRGLLGLTVKGAAWIGVTGLFLGLAAGAEHHNRNEVLALSFLMVGLAFVGEQMVNRPFDPRRGLFPPIYFSDAAAEIPRQENWGGLWLALLGAGAVVLSFFDEPVAPLLAACSAAAGGVGFAVGAVLQAWGQFYLPGADWWKVMEFSFGLLAGAGIAVGLLVSDRLRGWTPPRPPAEPLETRSTLLLLGLWACLLFGSDASREVSELWDWPFVQMAVLAPVAWSAAPGPGWIAGGLTCLATAYNVAMKLGETGRLQPEWVGPLLVLPAGLGGVAGIAFLARRGCGPEWALLALAVVQYGLCAVKAFSSGQQRGQLPTMLGLAVCLAVIAAVVLGNGPRRGAEPAPA